MKGIYKITNKKDGKFYIGSSSNICTRWEQHLHTLIQNNHPNHKLQKAFNTHGLKSFTFEVVKAIKKTATGEDLLKEEQLILNELTPFVDSIGYNISDTSHKKFDSAMEVATDEKFKTSILSEEVKLKLRENLNILSSQNDKLINKYNDKTILSQGWFYRNRNNDEKMDAIRKDVTNYIKNRVGVSQNNKNYWTCPSNSKDKIEGKGYIKSWVPWNIVDLKEKRNNLVFCINIFPNSFVENNVLENTGEEVDTNEYALLVLVRWVCCTADINKKINIYIPSGRMRKVLLDWLSLE